VKRALWFAVFLLIVLLAGAARCHRLRDVFIADKIYFLDPDCYSRMTRARMVSEGKALTIRQHDFENWPQGVTPHTTAPLDWLIVALKETADLGFKIVDPTGLSVLKTQTLDLAGAFIGPLLGMFACTVLALMLRRSRWSLAAAALFAVSPILVHGTSLGRPDHQALLIALLAVALVLELRLLNASAASALEDAPESSGAQHEEMFAMRARKQTAIVAGVVWGVALWVSLYEPLVLLVLVLLGLGLAQPSAFRARERWRQWGATIVVFAISVLIDGWRISLPPAELREAFQRWQLSIGELRGPDTRVILNWLGAACVLAPIALGWQWRKRPEARWLLVLLVATFALTCWQLRWGYFLALVFALSLPVQVEAFQKRRWIAGVLLFAGLWPVAKEWDTTLFNDDPSMERYRVMQRLENRALRDIAETQARRVSGPFLAPWWLSPALSYWTREPGVAGSSHESLPGILDSARVYLAPDAATALPILQARRVAWILSDAPDRIVPTSATLLGVPQPKECFAHTLVRYFDDERGLIPAGVTGVERGIKNQFFQAWRVKLEDSPPPPANIPPK